MSQQPKPAGARLRVPTRCRPTVGATRHPRRSVVAGPFLTPVGRLAPSLSVVRGLSAFISPTCEGARGILRHTSPPSERAPPLTSTSASHAAQHRSLGSATAPADGRARAARSAQTEARAHRCRAGTHHDGGSEEPTQRKVPARFVDLAYTWLHHTRCHTRYA